MPKTPHLGEDELLRRAVRGDEDAFLEIYRAHQASLYRYGDSSTERNAEVPVDEHNHALAALRYLVSRLDAGVLARLRAGKPLAAPAAPPAAPDDSLLWERLF